MIPIAPLPVIPNYRTGPRLGRSTKIKLPILKRKNNHANTLTKNKDAS